jgi:hypothetical protein
MSKKCNFVDGASEDFPCLWRKIPDSSVGMQSYSFTD